MIYQKKKKVLVNMKLKLKHVDSLEAISSLPWIKLPPFEIQPV